MLRTTLLFLFLLGFASAELAAAPAAATARPLHRRKPMAGNYRPVYKLYRHHSRRKNGFLGLFQHKPSQRHATTSPKTKARRGTL